MDDSFNVIFGPRISIPNLHLQALCSAAASRQQIDKIIFFLKSNPSLAVFQYSAYAYRLQGKEQFFMTEKESGEEEDLIEGFNEDVLLEGLGVKLLHLLKKFNVRNVIIVNMVIVKDSLRHLGAQFYRTGVKAAKDLINKLYEKLLKATQQKVIHRTQNIESKVFIPQMDKPQPAKRRTNRFQVEEFALKQPRQKVVLKKAIRKQYLKKAVEDVLQELNQCLSKLGIREISQINFLFEYDQNPVNAKIFQLFAAVLGVQDKWELVQVDWVKALRTKLEKGVESRLWREVRGSLLSEEKNFKKEREENSSVGRVLEFLEKICRKQQLQEQLIKLDS